MSGSSVPTYVLAACKPWHATTFDELRRTIPGSWHHVVRPDDLTPALVATLEPAMLFFVHWSWKVPAEITAAYECVCFHMGDVPRGRGGSPLQNHIERGARETMLTALRMIDEIDAGPVYAKRRLSLEGGAEEIFLRQSRLAADIIRTLIKDRPEPVPQVGEPEFFPRRRPEQSVLPPDLRELLDVHDFVRMLDADGYPRAFLEYGGWRFEFSRSALLHEEVRADVRITRAKGGTS